VLPEVHESTRGITIIHRGHFRRLFKLSSEHSPVAFIAIDKSLASSFARVTKRVLSLTDICAAQERHQIHGLNRPFLKGNRLKNVIPGFIFR
jgi:hypothetical protein